MERWSETSMNRTMDAWGAREPLQKRLQEDWIVIYRSSSFMACSLGPADPDKYN